MQGSPARPTPAEGIDPAYYTLSLLRRRRLEECVTAATKILETNAFDEQVWYIKTRALTLKVIVDDCEYEEEGVAEQLLEDNAMAAAPRPGTSLSRPLSNSITRSGTSRPVSNSGRPLSGYARPGTGSRTGTSSGLEGAYQGSRPGSARPVTTSGRFVRLGTASMQSEPGGPFINLARLDLKRYAARPALAKVLCEYIVYVESNPRAALELCAEATEVCKFNDWWWKARLGKCYYRLGLYRDAEKQFKSALKHQETIATVLELGKVYYKLDQPVTAIELFEGAAKRNPIDHHLLLGAARVYDQLNDTDKAVVMYKKVLQLNASNVEAIASIASNHYYDDQPEIALRLYRRLLQMGVVTTELWNNLGLCCFHASQYDMALSCFERALSLSNDESIGDVWYNIAQVAIGIGDVGLAYQALKIAVNVDSNHAEAFNNLGVLELRKGNIDQARNAFASAASLSAFIHEPLYNAALLCYKLGDLQEAYQQCCKSLQIFPDHTESQELKKQLRQTFTAA